MKDGGDVSPYIKITFTYSIDESHYHPDRSRVPGRFFPA